MDRLPSSRRAPGSAAAFPSRGRTARPAARSRCRCPGSRRPRHGTRPAADDGATSASRPQPARLGRLHVWSCGQGADLHADEPGVVRPPEDRDRDDDVASATGRSPRRPRWPGPTAGIARKRSVMRMRDRVHPTAGRACDEPDGPTDQHPDADDDERCQPCRLYAEQHAAQHVPSGLVGPERERSARTRVRRADRCTRVVRREQRREHGDRRDEGERAERDAIRQLIHTEGVEPAAPGRRATGGSWGSSTVISGPPSSQSGDRGDVGAGTPLPGDAARPGPGRSRRGGPRASPRSIGDHTATARSCVTKTSAIPSRRRRSPAG